MRATRWESGRMESSAGGRMCGGEGKARCRGRGAGGGTGESGGDGLRECGFDPEPVRILAAPCAGRPRPIRPSSAPCDECERTSSVAAEPRRANSSAGLSAGGEAGKSGTTVSVRWLNSSSRRSGRMGEVGASSGGESGWSCASGSGTRSCEGVLKESVLPV